MLYQLTCTEVKYKTYLLLIIREEISVVIQLQKVFQQFLTMDTRKDISKAFRIHYSKRLSNLHFTQVNEFCFNWFDFCRFDNTSSLHMKDLPPFL